ARPARTPCHRQRRPPRRLSDGGIGLRTFAGSGGGGMSAPIATGPLVEVTDLHVRFTGARTVHAVTGVSFSLTPGEVLGILGESGSGKSVTMKTLLGINPARRTQTSGRVRVAGHDVLALRDKALADYRGRVVSMIFQDPMLAFDPVYTIGDQIAESVRRH